MNACGEHKGEKMMHTESRAAVKLLTMLSLLLAAVSVPNGIGAEEQSASALPVSEARGYLGEWLLSFEFQGNQATMSLRFENVDGILTATLRSPAQPQPQVITDISTVSRGVKLEYSQQFGETEIAMTMILRLERGNLHGNLSAAGGVFSTEIHGDKGGKVPGRATLKFGGNDLKITYGALRTTADDYRRLGEVKDGEVFEYVYSRATKLFTDADLLFGDTLIRTENAGLNYPGVYSLWLKRVGDGWHLVFNEEADVWGTQHDPSKDVAEIPLTMRAGSGEQDRFLIEMEEHGDEGLLRLAWGPNEWTADFKLSQ